MMQGVMTYKTPAGSSAKRTRRGDLEKLGKGASSFVPPFLPGRAGQKSTAEAIATPGEYVSKMSSQRAIFRLGDLHDRFGLVARAALADANGSFPGDANDAYYRADAGGDANGLNPTLRLCRVDANGTTTVLAQTAVSLSAGSEYWMRLVVLDGTSYNLRAKVWPAADPEPGNQGQFIMPLLRHPETMKTRRNR